MTSRHTELAWGISGLTLAAWVTAFALPLPDPTVPFWSDLAWALPYMVFPLVGAAIIHHQPQNRIGWLLSVIGLVQGVGVLDGELLHQLDAKPAWHSYVPWLVLTEPLFLLSSLSIAVLLITFPDGRLPSPRWRWLVVGIAILLGLVAIDQVVTPVQQMPGVPASALANRAIAQWLDPLTSGDLYGLFLLAAATAIVARYRSGSGAVREQIKWFCLGVAVLIALSLAGGIADGVFHRNDVSVYFQSAGLLAMVAGIGIAVIRHRLYDVDLVISRSLTFGILAAVAAVVYVGLVAGVGALIGRSDGSNLVLSVAATALIALAFNPLRLQLQERANKLVYGQRETPYESLARFTRDLADSPTGDEVLSRATRVLASGLRGRAAAIYLRDGEERLPIASWPQREGLPTAPADRVEPVRYQGEEVGELAVWTDSRQPLNSAENRLIVDLAVHAGLLLRNARLVRELEGRVDELRASRRRLVTAQDAERRRLERDLHDGVQHELISLRMKLGLAEGALVRDAPDVAALVAEVREETADVLENIQRLSRGVHPPLLESQGLAAVLTAHARRLSIAVDVRASGDRFAKEIETAVYFCCVEALQNTVKHAKADRAWILIESTGDTLHFEVGDDGEGFDARVAKGGSGLQNITDRIDAVGGTICIESSPLGTRVSGDLPVWPPAPDKDATDEPTMHLRSG